MSKRTRLLASAMLFLAGWQSATLVEGQALDAQSPRFTAANWSRFRGPNGSGVARAARSLPEKWSPEANLQWKSKLPGPGSSCPIVLGNRVYVTCWSGYGTNEDDLNDQSALRRHLVAIDRERGEIVWQTEEPAELPEDEFGGMFAQHGYASHTPVTDGERIYVYFGKSGAIAYDLEGKRLWQTKVGEELDPRGWGSASSPILYKDLLIVSATAESEALVGLDKETGKEVWRQEASGLNGTWGTPVLVETEERDGGREVDLVIGVPGEIWGLHPATGKLRWYCETCPESSFCSSIVPGKEVVYAIEGRSGCSIAVRVGGRGDVSDSRVIWRGNDRNRIGTPLLYDDRLYFFNGGVANCIDATTGEEVFQERMTSRGGGGRGFRSGDYASAVAGDGKIFFVSRAGSIFVMEASADYRLLSVNEVTAAAEDFSATPAIAGDQLFIRSSGHLYSIKQEE